MEPALPLNLPGAQQTFQQQRVCADVDTWSPSKELVRIS